MTRDQADTRSGRDNQAYVLIRQVSRLLWETFVPGDPWTPPDDAERFLPE
jgi:hypothetical protein